MNIIKIDKLGNRQKDGICCGNVMFGVQLGGDRYFTFCPDCGSIKTEIKLNGKKEIVKYLLANYFQELKNMSPKFYDDEFYYYAEIPDTIKDELVLEELENQFYSLLGSKENWVKFVLENGNY